MQNSVKEGYQLNSVPMANWVDFQLVKVHDELTLSTAGSSEELQHFERAAEEREQARLLDPGSVQDWLSPDFRSSEVLAVPGLGSTLDVVADWVHDTYYVYGKQNDHQSKPPKAPWNMEKSDRPVRVLACFGLLREVRFQSSNLTGWVRDY